MPTDPTYPYSVEDIRRYLSGSMSPAEMHEMEKAALDDPLLADALDGYRTATPAVTDLHLNEIRSRISAQKPDATRQSPVVALHKTKWWRGLAAAAVIGIMATGAWFFMHPGGNSTSQIAKNSPPVAPSASRPLTDSVTAQNDLFKNRDSAAALQQLPAAAEEKTAKHVDVVRKTITVHNPPALQAEEAKIAAADQQVAQAPVPEMATIEAASPPSQANAFTTNAPVRIRGASTIAKAAPQNENGFMMVNRREPYYMGKVTDKSGNPIPGVTISTLRNQSTVSNVDGSFRLPALDSAGNLSFIAPGYQDKTLELLAGKVAGIQLNQADSNLSDVVVVGYRKQKKQALTGASSSYKVDTLPYKESPYPQGGWDSFYNNLTAEMGVNKYNASKDLHLRFTVENGLPEKFTVVKAPDEATAQKAISIIKKGPKWKTSKRKKKVDVKIKVD
ncbi:carboxypeptidase regulatory-like domain-containing protein [Niabella sp.]|uniref:carboxypeptidase regulatory-like domain-containing protein n=1 Tax=Niabella sp. TaxID=1962976 RepID=UPI00261DBF7E|nr:carboxypeptidase regulatory-like domain-containing protein [Niabella sp.]